MATDPRRLRALEIMARVKRLETEDKARAVGEIRARMSTFEAEKEALLGRLTGESRIEGLEGAPYLGRFIRSIRQEVDRNTAAAAKLAPELARAEDALRDALAEQKTFEILHQTRLREERIEKAKREEKAQDEISLLRWGQPDRV
ncbi:flagellar export protein FliJ [Sagittula salina]|uniref:Flagellar FliJ protein n=1 Tax=Sagittula salina TaxID=2820268 RepID=A0A940S4X2_9RHOB|nr:flagellar export protein FliJ [Sagittula salina]MBP0484564.1 flagellar FliJ family protein [Sagittula salina]